MTTYELINITFTAAFLLGAIYFWIRTLRLRVKQVKPTTSGTLSDQSTFSLISIAVSRNNDRTPQAAEQMFASLHGIFRANAEEQPTLSFEVAAQKGAILFYIYMPTELKDFVLSQVYAQYPNVEVTEIPLNADYAQLDEGLALAATELTFKKPGPYPIKTFVNFEVDPLSGITGVLSSAMENQSLWFQMIIQPIDDDWQDQGDEEIKKIKEPPKKSKGWSELMAEKATLFITDFFRAAVTGKVAEPEKKEEKKDKSELTGSQQQAVKGIEEKITKLGFQATIRLLSAAPDATFAQAKLEQLIGAFKQYNSLSLNSFVSKEITTDRAALDLYKAREIGTPEMIVNVTELASIYHFPSETVATPSITWAGSKKGEPPANLPIVGSVPADELTIFAETNYRSRVQKFGIKKKDRRLHAYIIGKTGTGKSTLMENMIFDDIREGRGVAVVDPHGELVDHILELIPESRVDDVVYFSPADHDFPIGFNVLEFVNPEFRSVVASGVVGIFKKIFGESWGPRLEYILRNCVLALLETPNSTLLGVMRILTDNAYRREVISNVSDPVVKDFFVNEFEKYDPKFRQEAIAPIQNKVGQFTSSATIRNIIGQPKSSIDIRQIMDTGKILLADLSTGRIGEDNSALLGSMLITKIQLSAMGRTNVVEDERRDFYLYVDEFQNFATDSFATILSEARKYRLNLVMINQYISQMPETVANAVFGNVGTMVAFRVGASDAEALKNEFQPVFDVNDLVNLPNRQIYLKMAIDGVTVPAFSASTLPPPAEKYYLRDQVVSRSREQFATPRSDVEDYISDWSAPIALNAPSGGGSKAELWRKIATEKPVTSATSSSESDDKSMSPVSEKGSEPTAEEKVGEHAPLKVGELTNHKIERLSDRFNRPWYSVAQHVEETPRTETPKSIALADEDRGVGEQSEEEKPLITWDKASELGLHLDQNEVKVSINHDELLPIDEL